VKSKVNCLFAVVIISGDIIIIIIIIGSRCVVLLYFSALMASLSFLDGLNKVLLDLLSSLLLPHFSDNKVSLLDRFWLTRSRRAFEHIREKEISAFSPPLDQQDCKLLLRAAVDAY